MPGLLGRADRVAAAGALVVVAGLGLLVAGCTSSSGPASPAGPSASSATPEAAVGATRVFDVDDNGRHLTKTLTLTALRRTGADVDETVTVAETGRPTQRVLFVLHPDGSVTDPASTDTAADGATVTYGQIVVPTPAVLRSGRVVHESVPVTVRRGGRTSTLTDQVSLNGDRPESVTVPAGTYQAVPITVIQDVGVAGDGATVETTVDRAAGVGTVRETQVTTEGGTTSTLTEVLVRTAGTGDAGLV